MSCSALFIYTVIHIKESNKTRVIFLPWSETGPGILLHRQSAPHNRPEVSHIPGPSSDYTSTLLASNVRQRRVFKSWAVSSWKTRPPTIQLWCEGPGINCVRWWRWW